VSHLPHLLAFALMHGVTEQPDGKEFLSWPGPAFATSPHRRQRPEVWRDILLANREQVLLQSQAFQRS
jgi:prephenate dehydrogenase